MASTPATLAQEEAPPSSAIVGANVYRNRVLRIPRMTQEQLAEVSGIALETLRQVERSRDPARPQLNLRLDTLDKLAEGLGIDAASLLTRTPSKLTGRRDRRMLSGLVGVPHLDQPFPTVRF